MRTRTVLTKAALSVVFLMSVGAKALVLDSAPFSTKQISQNEAGYPMGCQITSMIYALKFGNRDWQNAYLALPGNTDLGKIKYLATKFAKEPSRHAEGQPAFSESNASSYRDLPWMLESLIPNESSIDTLELLEFPTVKDAETLIFQKFSSAVLKSLKDRKPIIANLYFAEPEHSHAVVIVGITPTFKHRAELLIIDPGTGKDSTASVHAEDVTVLSNKVKGLSFFGPNVDHSSGTIVSITAAIR